MNKGITPAFLEECRAFFGASPTGKIAQNAMASASTSAQQADVVADHNRIRANDFTFSTKLDEWSVTNQKQSGRCWLFAALNLFRVGAMKKLNVKEFEFSQAYIHFWDKFERANTFLESCIDLVDKDVDDRTMAWLLSDPIGDGGQWGMAMNLIRKHGLVPKSAYPESPSSSATLCMNNQLKTLLRTACCELRELRASGSSPEDLALHRLARVKDVWLILCIHLGTPPADFVWQWRDKDKVFHHKGKMTPAEFAKEYVTEDWEDYVCLVNDPRNPYYQTYTVDRLQSVAHGPPVVYLNVPIQEMKDITKAVLVEGKTPVWMGCDVGKQMHRKTGVCDAKLFDWDSFYGCSKACSMTKAQRLMHGETMMTHAMLFTGVDMGGEGEESTLKWRVENSWGDEYGNKGFLTMNDNWYDEHMFEISAPSKYLTEKQKEGLKTTPIMLPAWDPMGSLAKQEAHANIQ